MGSLMDVFKPSLHLNPRVDPTDSMLPYIEPNGVLDKGEHSENKYVSLMCRFN